MTTGVKIGIGVGAAAVVAFSIYWFFIRETDKVVKKVGASPSTGGSGSPKTVSEEDSEKIPLINEIIYRISAVSKFKDEASKKEMQKKEYNFWMTKTLKEVQEKHSRTK